MEPKELAERVRDEADRRGLGLIETTLSSSDGWNVEPDQLDTILTYAQEHGLPLILYEKLNPERGRALVRVCVEGPHSVFNLKASEDQEE